MAHQFEFGGPRVCSLYKIPIVTEAKQALCAAEALKKYDSVFTVLKCVQVTMIT